MANVMLGFPNLIDAATLSGGSWETTLPLTNLQNRIIAKVAQTTNLNLASTQFLISLSSPVFARVFALVGHNLSMTAKYRLRAFTDALLVNVVWDSGWVDVWPVVYPLGSFAWGDPRIWTGKYTPNEISGYNLCLTAFLPAALMAQYYLVEIDDSANTAGAVRIGRPFLAPGWVPGIGLRYQSTSLALETNTQVQEAKSGTEYFNERPTYRVEQFALSHLTEDEGMAGAFEIQRQAGISKEVFFVKSTTDDVHSIRTRFLGRCRKLSSIEYPYFQHNSTAFEIKELL